MAGEPPVAALNVDLGQRSKLVDLVPAVLVVSTVGLLYLGDWASDPSKAAPTWWSAGLLLGGAFILALALRPFQIPLVRWLEGYWKPGRVTAFLFDLGVQRQRDHRNDLRRTVNAATMATRRI